MAQDAPQAAPPFVFKFSGKAGEKLYGTVLATLLGPKSYAHLCKRHERGAVAALKEMVETDMAIAATNSILEDAREMRRLPPITSTRVAVHRPDSVQRNQEIRHCLVDLDMSPAETARRCHCSESHVRRVRDAVQLSSGGGNGKTNVAEDDDAER